MGAAVFWDATAGVVATTITDNRPLGIAVAAALASAATVRVRIG
nr:capsid cement protein [Paracoccus binzhouensis]